MIASTVGAKKVDGILVRVRSGSFNLFCKDNPYLLLRIEMRSHGAGADLIIRQLCAKQAGDS